MSNSSSSSSANKESSSLSSWMWSIGSITFMFILLSTTMQWYTNQDPRSYNHKNKRNTNKTNLLNNPTVDVIITATDNHPTSTSRSIGSNRFLLQHVRQLQEQGGGGVALNDEKSCQEYIIQFLNNETQSSKVDDELCEGYSNAYKEAKCEDNNNNNNNDNNKECCTMIQTVYDKHCLTKEVMSSMDATKLLMITLVFIVCGVTKAIFTKRLPYIPDAGACIIVGAIVGGIIRLLMIRSNEHDDQLSFDNDLFLRILLPPIIFQAALSIDKRSFTKHIFAILLFSIVGTVFSALIIGYCTYYMSNYIWKRGISLPLLDSLLFGSLMSSIDPVATLSILSSVGIQHNDPLYILIFGESLLNDGVSIVLFESLIEHMGDSDVVDAASFSDTIHDFFIVCTGSILIGIVCGMISTIYFWLLHRKQNDVSETALFFAWALIPYYIADGLKYSGIISIMVMGFVMDYYVIGGFQSEDNEWMEYMEMRCNNNNNNNINTSSGTLRINNTTNPNNYNNNNNDNQQQQQQNPVSNHHYRNASSLTNDEYYTTNYYNTNGSLEPCFQRIIITLSKAFSGRGHLMNRTRHHVGFVAEVITAVMETAIFAYLGLFLFSDREYWNFKLMTSGLFCCIASRASMVLILSNIVNVCVFFNVEQTIGRGWKKIRFLFRQLNTNTNNHADTSISMMVDNDDDDDGIMMYGSGQRQRNNKVYLNPRTQMILFSAGIRGAVSYALVQNIPVYDAVTKHGSHYKGELRAMASATITILLFAFGALTYFTVNNNNNTNQYHRMDSNSHPSYMIQTSMNSALFSVDELGDETASDMNSLLLDNSIVTGDDTSAAADRTRSVGYPNASHRQHHHQQYPAYEAPQPPTPPSQQQ